MIYDPSRGGMMAVFEKHKEELEGFEKLYSGKTGRLVFAMCILSDIYEILSVLSLRNADKAIPEILTELNEVQELLNSFVKEELGEKWITKGSEKR